MSHDFHFCNSQHVWRAREFPWRVSYRGEKVWCDDPAFEYVCMLGANANVLLINPKTHTVRNVAELIELAERQPGSLTFDSNGFGSSTHPTT
nr:tripartite tricarboxylate transporter substrate-binding protein [Polaromonas sp.]